MTFPPKFRRFVKDLFSLNTRQVPTSWLLSMFLIRIAIFDDPIQKFQTIKKTRYFRHLTHLKQFRFTLKYQKLVNGADQK